MQIHKTIKPIFVRNFQCVGPECLMSCCRGWTISIDKKTHGKYISSTNTEISRLAKENLIPLQKGKNSYSRVKLNEEGNCPFIDEDKLCLIHRELGESALSHTCSTYPRGSTRYEEETRHTMTLSCPEVARLVLFDPDAMLLQEEESLRAVYKTNLIGRRQSMSEVDRVIHLFAWNIIRSPSRNVEENLMALAHFIVCLQHVDFDLHNKLNQVEDYYEMLMADLRNGHSLLKTTNIGRSNAMKYLALSVMGSTVARFSAREEIILSGHRAIADYLDFNQHHDPLELDKKFDALTQQWHSLCEDSCLSEPHVLRNYLLYKLYSSYFPGNTRATILRQFYRIVLDFFYLKIFLSVKASQEEIHPHTLMKTIAGFSEKTMHNSSIDARLDNAIDKINGGDDLSCLLLIG
ncbi:flagellin lysine-N-methylase [Enterobacter hormaechei]|uniref:flagellin lysine-N-methylase n=1 Tax=Enterobacter cloacae complex TaxID=354276 RepID=UPI00084CC434|nr:flagellin lysine-N-methylase [Enterobacter hormaechei]AOP99686.1 lysine-N-methylase [Enterobacter hormaechei subsp. hoffmannii]MDY3584057.1 flagellin lysine-N-methylase [Enterobacter hormaechei]